MFLTGIRISKKKILVVQSFIDSYRYSLLISVILLSTDVYVFYYFETRIRCRSEDFYLWEDAEAEIN